MSSLYTTQGINRFADIILPLNMPKALTYGIPHDWDELLLPGMRIEVALGKNKKYAGILLRLHEEKPEAYEVKPILSLLDETPVVNEKQLIFWQWIAAYYVAAPGEVMQAALPAHLKLIGETKLLWSLANGADMPAWSMEAVPVVALLQERKSIAISDLKSLVPSKSLSKVLHELLEHEAITINDALEPSYKKKKEKILALHPSLKAAGTLEQVFKELDRSPKKQEALMAFLAFATKKTIVRQEDFITTTSTTAAQIKGLADKDILQITEQDVDRLIFSGEDEQREIIFTPQPGI